MSNDPFPRDEGGNDDRPGDEQPIEGELVLPGTVYGSAENDTYDGEVLDADTGGEGTQDTREAAAEIVGALTLVARGLYRPARLLALIALPAAVLALITGLILGGGLGVFSVLVGLVVILAAGFVTLASVLAARATENPDSLRATVNSALAKRRGTDATFDRELAGQFAPIAGGMRIRNVWALTGALRHLPGYPGLRPFLPPWPRLAVIATVVSLLGMFLSALLFVVNLLALAVG